MVSISSLIIFLPLVSAFQAPLSVSISRSSFVDTKLYDTPNQNVENNNDTSISRRAAITTTISTLTIGSTIPQAAYAADPYDAASLGEKQMLQTYEDFTATEEGWSYKEVKIGKDIGGGEIKDGDRVVFDWSGYTIGYFGRPFEAKGGPQGGAFDKDLNYFRTTLGSKTLIPGLECALRSMKPGGIRQVIIPYGALSYPPEDKEHDLVGPKPTTFSGMRALNFVLDNPRVDRTLLFNVKLIRVDRGDGKGGFIRG